MGRINQKTVIVRKPRNCFGCLQKINKGESANIQTNSENGKIYSLTICPACQLKINQMHHDDEFYNGDLAEPA